MEAKERQRRPRTRAGLSCAYVEPQVAARPMPARCCRTCSSRNRPPSVVKGSRITPKPPCACCSWDWERLAICSPGLPCTWKTSRFHPNAWRTSEPADG